MSSAYFQLLAIVHNVGVSRSACEGPMSLHSISPFVAACIALALLPGPVVTLVIANGLRHGTRAALNQPSPASRAGWRS